MTWIILSNVINDRGTVHSVHATRAEARDARYDGSHLICEWAGVSEPVLGARAYHAQGSAWSGVHVSWMARGEVAL